MCVCCACAVCVVCVDRQKVLVHHPDKKQQVALAVGEGEGEGEGDDHFKCIKIGETKDCTHKWIGNAVQNFSSSNFFSGHIVRVREKSVSPHPPLAHKKYESVADHYTHPCVPTVYACEFLVAFIWCLCKKYESFKITRHYHGNILTL